MVKSRYKYYIILLNLCVRMIIKILNVSIIVPILARTARVLSIVINIVFDRNSANTNKSSFIPAGAFRVSHNKIFEDLFNKRATKLQRPRHRHAVINGRKVPREKRSPRRSLFRYHEHARSLGNFREVLPEVLRSGVTFLILREDRIVLVAAPPRKIENRR